MLKPIFEELSEEYKGKLKFAKINTDHAPDIAGKYNISAIPCLIITTKGKELGRIEGIVPKQLLKQKIDAILAKTKN